jgi:uncharacterized protein with gpF-like domain
MRFNLAAMFRRQRNPRRKVVTIRQIVAPSMFATNLYQAAYADVIAAWQAAIPDLLDIYARTLASMQTDAPADAGARISRVQSDLGTVFVSVRARLERWAALIEAWQRGKWRSAVLSATGVDLATMIGPGDVRETLGAVIERNVALVSSVSDEARQRISEAVFRGLQNRTPAEQVGREIREAVDMGRRRARNIAADQTVKLASALNEERRLQAGITAWEWIHSEKLHPRPAHVARNHALYSDDPEQVGEEAEGKTIHAPPADRPGQLPYCGCTSRAVLILA